MQLRLIGGEASLWVDGAQKVSHDYGSDALAGGSNQVGLGTRNALAAFDNVEVSQYTPPAGVTLPYSEDFSDAGGIDLTTVSGSWSVDGEGRYSAQVSAGSNALTLLPVLGDLPVNLQVSADIVGTEGGSGYYANGLVIYDYESSDDFKYAGAFLGGNKWKLGHYSGGQWTTDAQLDETLDLDTSYSVQLRLIGGEASLWVDGVQKVSHDYGSDALAGGSNQVGLGTRNALAAFDNLAVNAWPVA